MVVRRVVWADSWEREDWVVMERSERGRELGRVLFR